MNNSDYYQSYLEFPADVVDSEFDCLNLFVIRPSPEALARVGCDDSGVGLPVLVWIHGGGYGFGAGTDPMWGMHSLPNNERILDTEIRTV